MFTSMNAVVLRSNVRLWDTCVSEGIESVGAHLGAERTRQGQRRGKWQRRGEGGYAR